MVYPVRAEAIISRMNDTAITATATRRSRILARPAALVVAVLATWAAPFSGAVAQAAQKVSAPEAPSPWLEWLLVFAFGGLCVGIAFKNPKRSHQN